MNKDRSWEFWLKSKETGKFRDRQVENERESEKEGEREREIRYEKTDTQIDIANR